MFHRGTTDAEIPWLNFCDGHEVHNSVEESDEPVGEETAWAGSDQIDPGVLELLNAGLISNEADAQIILKLKEELALAEELEEESEEYLDASRFLGADAGILRSFEAYKRLLNFDTAAAERKRQRRLRFQSGELSRKKRREQRDAMFEARRRIRRARFRVLELVEKILRMEAEEKVRRFEKWQQSRRKVQLYHDRFDSRIAGYAPDQKERLERYRDSLDKQSRFAFMTDKKNEAAEKLAEISRFQASNTPPGNDTPSTNNASEMSK